MITVKLSERNLLSMLHKLCMPGSAREITKWSEDQPGEPSQQVAIRVATDEEVYGDRAPGQMHPETEIFVANIREQVAKIADEMYPSEQAPQQ